MIKQKILVIFGGPSNEHAVSVHTSEVVIKNLSSTRYDVMSAYIQKNGAWRFGNAKVAVSLPQAMNKLERLRPIIAFLALHGAFGEDGTIQTLLQTLKIPYTGSGPLASALAMDKELSNIIYQHAGFLVPSYKVISADDYSLTKDFIIKLDWPLVVKPNSGGSSVGITIVHKPSRLRSAIRKALLEDVRVMLQKCVLGQEVTCGVLEINGKPVPLPITEIIPHESTFFDYRAKYQVGGSDEITPARISSSLTKTIQTHALKAHCLLNCRGISRTDFIVDKKGAWILETNTIPGMTKTSLLPQGAMAAGISYSRMLDLIILSALKA